jgi:hypothetical protein
MSILFDFWYVYLRDDSGGSFLAGQLFQVTHFIVVNLPVKYVHRNNSPTLVFGLVEARCRHCKLVLRRILGVVSRDIVQRPAV